MAKSDYEKLLKKYQRLQAKLKKLAKENKKMKAKKPVGLKVKNPISGRMILSTGSVFKKLVKSKVLNLDGTRYVNQNYKDVREMRKRLRELEDLPNLDLYNDDVDDKINKLFKSIDKAKQRGKADKVERYVRVDGIFKNYQHNYEVAPTDDNFKHWELFLEYFHGVAHKVLKLDIRDFDNIKFFLTIKTVWKTKPKLDKDGAVVKEPETKDLLFTSGITTVNDASELGREVRFQVRMLQAKFEDVENVDNDSSLVFDHIVAGYVNSGKVTYRGASYLPLPEWIANKKACINVQNEDNRCFRYSVCALIHPAGKHAQRVTKYPNEMLDELKMGSIVEPVVCTPANFRRFEQLNQNISVNVFSVLDDGFSPVYISSEEGREHHVNLLMVSDDEISHYVAIKDIDKLLNDGSHNKLYHCLNCMSAFTRPEALERHTEGGCKQFAPCRLEMPENTELTFKNTVKQQLVPFTIYADFESITVPVDECKGAKTKMYQSHQACGVCLKLVSRYEGYDETFWLYRGADAVDRFIEKLLEIEDYVVDKYQNYKKMEVTPEELARHRATKDCWLCGGNLRGDKVMDHDHFSGRYRGASHFKCNINYNWRHFKIPVVLHNLKGYDSHLIFSRLGFKTDSKIEAIPETMEKYKSFTVGKLQFIDSLSFLGCSLEKMVDTMAKDDFHCLKQRFPEHYEELAKKGVYPYDWMDSTDKFEQGYPVYESFYSKLDDKNIKEKDYERGKKIYDMMGCGNMGDYHDLYLTTDVLLLADVFEKFRTMCFNYYKLDPCHYITAPALAWDALLSFTGVTLQLISDVDMYIMLESSKRGGITQSILRYAQANNQYMSNFDDSQSKKFITYIDANNLYGWAMTQCMPVNGFKWNNDEWTAEKIAELKPDARKGYIFEVDLEYPAELHDLHADLPLAPENMSITADMTSQHYRNLLEQNGCKHFECRKLVTTLTDKTKYVLHYRNLQLYLSLGMKLKQVHRVIQFNQEAWMKPYIDFNTERRNEAKASRDEFGKNFFKLMNNSPFGKTMEDVRKYKQVHIEQTEERVKKMLNNPRLRRWKEYESVACYELEKSKATLCRPIAVGFSILDVSKIVMYNFHYNFMKSHYADKAKLCYMDTDSFIYQVECDDFYKVMKAHPEYFDNNVLGAFKDETDGVPITEFVGLKAKSYSYKLDDGKQEKKQKGIKKAVVKQIDFDEYKRTLTGGMNMSHSMNTIRQYDHHIYSISSEKTSLSALDNKRYILEDGVTTLPYGHYSLQ